MGRLSTPLLALCLLTPAAASAEPVSVDQVVALSRAGLGDEAVIAKIRASGSRFDLSTDQMLALKRCGVSGPVIAAMLSAREPATAEAAPSGGTGTVMVYRDRSIVGIALGCRVREQGRKLAEVGRGRSARLELAAGRHVLTSGASSLALTVEPGGILYVRCEMKGAMTSGHAALREGDAADYASYAPTPVATR